MENNQNEEILQRVQKEKELLELLIGITEALRKNYVLLGFGLDEVVRIENILWGGGKNNQKQFIANVTSLKTLIENETKIAIQPIENLKPYDIPISNTLLPPKTSTSIPSSTSLPTLKRPTEIKIVENPFEKKGIPSKAPTQEPPAIITQEIKIKKVKLKITPNNEQIYVEDKD